LIVNQRLVIDMNNPQGVIVVDNSQTVILRALARRISWDPSHMHRMTKRIHLSWCG